MRFVLLFLVLAGASALPPFSQTQEVGGPVEEFLCDLCYWFFAEIEKLLANGHSEQDVLTYLHEVVRTICNSAFESSNFEITARSC